MFQAKDSYSVHLTLMILLSLKKKKLTIHDNQQDRFQRHPNQHVEMMSKSHKCYAEVFDSGWRQTTLECDYDYNFAP